MQVDHFRGLSASDVHVWRGEKAVLRGVDLQAAPGELLHVQGPNGSGKTTLMRVLSGLASAEVGEVRWNGLPIDRQRDEYGASTSYLGHVAGLKDDLSATENLRYGAGLKRALDAAAIAAALSRLGLAAQAGLPARVLSAGQRRRLALARVLLEGTTLWLLDEPFTNLDRDGGELLAKLLVEHAEEGGIAVLASHQALPIEASRVRTQALA